MAAMSVTHIRLELQSVTTASLAGLACSPVIMHNFCNVTKSSYSEEDAAWS